jgi:hypothetical protein
VLWGQATVGSTVASDSSAIPTQVLTSFQTEQQALANSFGQLLALNPTLGQMQAWQQQNAAALTAQQERAQYLASVSALEPQPVPGAANIPAGASQNLTDFLTTQAALAQARAQIHNQLLDALPENVSDAQLSQMQQSEEQLFQQQHATDLQLQQQRAQVIANESASQPLPVPPPLVIPAGTSSRMATFLTLRDQIMRAHVALWNQLTTVTPVVRDAALQQWAQQNAGLIQQMQQAAQNVSTIPATTQN